METTENLTEWNNALRDATPQGILRWAFEKWGADKVGLAASFGGVSGMALLDMAAKIEPKVRVFYLDTDFLFPETYATRDRAAEKYGIVPLGYRAKLSPDEQAEKFGPELWKTNPDLCCALRKVEPNRRAVEGLSAWIAGLRRDQSSTRRAVEPVNWDSEFGLYKLAPLWNWTENEVQAYLRENEVPVNPLHAMGYASIGCTNCTRAIGVGEDLRAGRWAENEKTECGLHQRKLKL